MPGPSESDVFCAEASREVGEPLAGTAAAETSRWLVLEQAGAWGPKGVEDSGLPADVTAYLQELGRLHRGLRVQLVRRHDQATKSGGVRVFLAETDESLGRLFSLELPHLSVLPSLGLEAWLQHGTPPHDARESSEPLYLVCTHGKRDRCCALRGMPLYNALRELAPERVWQTTHLGGHRFAATMVVLPHGISYGRLSEHDAGGLYAAHQAAEMFELGKVRGRTCYSGPAQAAEVQLRERLGERRLDALELAGEERFEAGGRVRFRRREEPSSECLVELERVAVPPAPASCGAKPKAGEGLVALRLR
ncbi:MAG: sucrase ferredoxin [Myxococcales bacterium]